MIATELSRPKPLPATATSGVRCRQIAVDDLDAVADLLTIGFPRRDRGYWVAALRYLQERNAPAGLPRYGYLLTQNNRIAGALLLIFTEGINGRADAIRCNVSSWYVMPELRSLAPLLVLPVLRHKQVTFVNTSPADNTLPTITAQGFRQFAQGMYAALPALTTRGLTGKVIRLTDSMHAQDYLPEHEVALLREHAARGCLSLILQHRGECHPLVLQRRLVAQRGPVGMPCAQLIYARGMADVVALSGLIGRFLALRGMPVLLLSANGAIGKLPGKYYAGRASMYYRGPEAPQLCDLAYTEAALFGA